MGSPYYSSYGYNNSNYADYYNKYYGNYYANSGSGYYQPQATSMLGNTTSMSMANSSIGAAPELWTSNAGAAEGTSETYNKAMEESTKSSGGGGDFFSDFFEGIKNGFQNLLQALTDPKTLLLMAGMIALCIMFPPLGTALMYIGGGMAALQVLQGVSSGNGQQAGEGAFNLGLAIIGGKSTQSASSASQSAAINAANSADDAARVAAGSADDALNVADDAAAASKPSFWERTKNFFGFGKKPQTTPTPGSTSSSSTTTPSTSGTPTATPTTSSSSMPSTGGHRLGGATDGQQLTPAQIRDLRANKLSSPSSSTTTPSTSGTPSTTPTTSSSSIPSTGGHRLGGATDGQQLTPAQIRDLRANKLSSPSSNTTTPSTSGTPSTTPSTSGTPSAANPVSGADDGLAAVDDVSKARTEIDKLDWRHPKKAVDTVETNLNNAKATRTQLQDKVHSLTGQADKADELAAAQRQLAKVDEAVKFQEVQLAQAQARAKNLKDFGMWDRFKSAGWRYTAGGVGNVNSMNPIFGGIMGGNGEGGLLG